MVNNLQANMLINTNIIVFENIIIDLANKRFTISQCKGTKARINTIIRNDTIMSAKRGGWLRAL